MKYLVYSRPSKELNRLILDQSGVTVSSLGLHSTICLFHMDQVYEGRLISELSKVKFEQFEIETLCYDEFDKDSLVLRLSSPKELLRLHRGLVCVLKGHEDQRFCDVEKRYFGENYKPHITISKSSFGFDKSSMELLGKKFTVSRYSLARKVEDTWEELRTFYS